MAATRAHGRGLTLGLAALSIMAGCHARRPAAAPDPIAELERDPAGLIRRVSELRGLAERRPTTLLFQDEKTFLRALDAGGGGSATASDFGSVYAAFGFDVPSARKGTSAGQVMHEQVVAFYDPTTHSVHVRKGGGGFGGSPDEVKGLVAHELGHSLQHQHFNVPKVEDMTDLDQRLASMALIEGDAMLTMIAYIADENDVRLNRALAAATNAANQPDTVRYAQGTGGSDALMRSPGLMRERVMFPYMQGMAFLSQVHRAGGFPLVNQVYASPPATTEQVLHPEKYVAGEQAIPVEFPGVPPGWKVALDGRMGELQTRVILDNCTSHDRALRASSGWGGDRFMLIERQGLALMWLTEWDTEEDAGEFEVAAKELVRCWASKPGGTLASGVGPGELIQRSGSSVALIRGMSAEEREKLAPAMLALKFTRPPPTPRLGAIQLPRIPVEPKTQPAYLSQTGYVNQRLGISLPAPPGYSASLEDGQLHLERQQQPVSSMHMALSEREVTPRALNRLYDEFEDAILKEIGRGMTLSVEGNGYYTTPLGNAVMRTWVVNGTSVRMRVVLLPICNSSASVMFSNVWVEPSGLQMADWWLGGLRPLTSGKPPACATLDP